MSTLFFGEVNNIECIRYGACLKNHTLWALNVENICRKAKCLYDLTGKDILRSV